MEEEEFEVGFGSDCEFEIDSTDSDDREQEISPETIEKLRHLENVIYTYSAYMSEYPAVINEDWSIDVKIPSSFLPLSMQAVYGFSVDPVLLNVSIVLNDFSWNRPPISISVTHPVYEKSFIGQTLVSEVIKDFFSENYKPRSYYRSELYLLTATGTADPAKVAELVEAGFDESRAKNALIVCGNDEQAAITFLKTGDSSGQTSFFKEDYAMCPLIYLILELSEVFLDLMDHCCNCRAPITPGLKASTCDAQLCRFQMTDIGIGGSVLLEIKRDPKAADLVLSLFSAAVGSKFLVPAPPKFTVSEIQSIMTKMPPMEALAQSCKTDQGIVSMIGKNGFELLRWVLLSNDSHLISLPKSMQFSDFEGSAQFMTLLSSPDAEEVFDRLKKKYGSCYIWHGSDGARWHSIIRNGLKNATGTPMQRNGAILGPGIYFSRTSQVSWGYSRVVPNGYRASTLGRSLQVIALCEVAKIPSTPVKEVFEFRRGSKGLSKVKVEGALVDHTKAFTLTMEEACIVRFLMVGGGFSVDTIANPPQHIPTLRDVLEFHADNKM